MVTTTERKHFPKDDWFYKYYYDMRRVAQNCRRCSCCKWIDSWEVKDIRFAKVCPSVAYMLYDAYSCQGRMDLTLGILDGRIKYEDSPKLLDVVYKCNTCGGCDASCKRLSDMEPLRVMLDLRARLVEDGELLPQHMPVIDNLRKEDNMMLQPKAGRGKWAEGLPVKNLATEKAEVAFHAGCRISFDEALWPVARTAVSLLHNAGVDVGIMGEAETCCGTRAHDMGYHGEFTKYAENNIDAWNNAGVKTVVSACADGYLGMKRLYPDAGAKVKVLHVLEFLERLIAEGKIKLKRSVPLTVTYHDPCHLGRRMSQAAGYYVPGQAVTGLYEPPRNLIRSIPGIKLVEMFRIREYAWCCGAGGGVKEAYPDFSLWTAQERINEAAAVGAEAIVTACPWCEGNFSDAIASTCNNLKVLDIVELVAQSI